MPSVSHRGAIHLGLDVHKDSISVAVLEPDREAAEVDKIFHDEYSVRRLIARFPEPRNLRACYEAGPTGYDLHRLLATIGVPCDVVAPSLIPKAPGDRVKTDRRDCRRLARLHRAGELVAIRVPTLEEEAVRDLCRARGDMVEDRTRARHRLSKFLLRHGRIYREGRAWTMRHEQWLVTQHSTTGPCSPPTTTTGGSSRPGTPQSPPWRRISFRTSPPIPSGSRSVASPPTGG
ncbi:MAG TPA: transposase [Actinomycetota bacterium]|nr:transposase [Actinomycetota bacterium]